jgi:deazaflavin-dependent oxidoreductase (nitroreductase family)
MTEQIEPLLSLPYPSGLVRAMLRLPVWLYRLGLGEVLNLIHIMMLTTRGRRSGIARHTAIEYRRHGSKFYAISAWGDRPHWFKNLQDYPYATLRLGSKRVRVVATPVVNHGEALRVIHLFRRTAPFYYDSLLAWMSEEDVIDQRELPNISSRVSIMRLDPTTEEVGIPYHEASLGWVLPTIALVSAAVVLVVNLTRSRRD